MKIRILPAAVLCLGLASVGLSQEPRNLRLERDDFFREILSSKTSPRTLYYDGTVEGSYQVAKNDIVRGLPEAAKAQGVDLRGLYLFGPYGSMHIVIVYVFAAEKGSIRINQVKMVQSRLIAKSTGFMTLTKYQNMWDGLLKTNVLSPGLASDGPTEELNETVLCRWSDGNLDSYYGSVISPKPGADVTKFSRLTGVLLQSLTNTARPPAVSQPGTTKP